MTTRYQRLHDDQVGTSLGLPGNLELAAQAAGHDRLSCQPSTSKLPSPASRPPLAPPLYPAYLPTRPENFSPARAHPPFDAVEVGLKAAPELPVLQRAMASAVDRPGRLEQLTPRIGSEYVAWTALPDYFVLTGSCRLFPSRRQTVWRSTRRP